MTPDPCKRPPLLPVLLVIGGWIVTVFVLSVLTAGHVLLGFLAGAALGGLVYFPIDRHVRRAASAKLFITVRRQQRASGRDGEFEAGRRRAAALEAAGILGTVTKAVDLVTVFLKWLPTGLFAVLSLFGLVVALRGDAGHDLSVTVIAVCCGTGAVFALLSGLRANIALSTPWDELGRPIADLTRRQSR